MGWGRGREQPSHNPHETLERGKGGKGREGKGGKGREGKMGTPGKWGRNVGSLENI